MFITGFLRLLLKFMTLPYILVIFGSIKFIFSKSSTFIIIRINY